MPGYRLLLLVSRDFGELSFALDFARSEGLDALLLVPASLRGALADEDKVQFTEYAGLGGVRTAVESHKPDLVLLCSGYLLGVGGLLGAGELASLVQSLGRLGIPVLTSDPFLGLSFSPNGVVGVDVAVKPLHIALPHGAAMAAHIAQVAQILRACTHIYLAPCGHLRSPMRLACRATRAALPSQEMVWQEGLRPSWPALLRAKPHWLFVLSNEDWLAQSHRWGQDGFLLLLAARMSDARKADRTAVLVAPPACAQALGRFVAADAQVVVLPFCTHRQFEALLRGAEFAFYWNRLSHSLLFRFLNLLPVFFFDHGHLMRAVPELAALSHETYYCGFVMPELDVRDPLPLAQLAMSAADSLDGRVALRRRYDGLPEPVEVLRSARAAIEGHARGQDG